MERSFSLKQKKTDRSLLSKSGITRVMSVLERRSRSGVPIPQRGRSWNGAAAFLMAYVMENERFKKIGRLFSVVVDRA